MTSDHFSIRVASSAGNQRKSRATKSDPVKWIGGARMDPGELRPLRERCAKPEAHRADQEAFRKPQPIREKAEAIARREGGNRDVVAAQLAILAKVAAKRETTDNIGRAV